MIDTLQLRVDPKVAASMLQLKQIASDKLGIKPAELHDAKVVRRSVDARQQRIMVNISLRVAYGNDKSVAPISNPVQFKPLSASAPTAIVVGAGPAGLFASLRLIEHGIRPILLERGKDVDRRREDITSLNRHGIVNPDSNYCFGEGGAGTFSDGKLFTRSKKRGNVDEILQLLHQHGASENILIDAHPHIGSDRLPHVVKAIRKTIIDCGGQVYFDTRVVRLIINDHEVTGIETADGSRYFGKVILATGHSARDIYRALDAQQIALEAKGFAVGVRLEHPQHLIDCIQYHSQSGRGDFLPAAEYSFVTQVDNRGVYSFCMCPGGVVVPSASGPDQSAVNGMSASARAGHWSNSGMVVEIRPGDFPEYEKYGPLQLLHLQEDLENKFYEEAGGTMVAPAQRMKDFTEGKLSRNLPPSSYVPGLKSARLDLLLPEFISFRLKKGFRHFGHRSKGFLTNEATMIGLESRTSSPVRIPRDKETLTHPDYVGLYPCGEGAGFAGGIVSAAIDGRRCADALAALLSKEK